MVERAQRGDRDAYEQLARGAASRLLQVAVRIVRDPDRAEDAVQQTLVDIWRDLPTLRDPDRFEAWTYRIVVRHCRAEARRGRLLEGRVVDLSEEMAAGGDPIGDVAVRDQLGRAFRSLSHDQRVVVVLHHYVGLPLGDVAEILDCPYGTVGSRLYHAMRAMRAHIDAAERTIVPGGQPA
ncbi:MAG: sigma-70 family RNA polymerase sigma factor [Chloroflexi bacterium]|nr:sigma-70 family RNA polymerase sigma factor [Chloroflexota bacterium]